MFCLHKSFGLSLLFQIFWGILFFRKHEQYLLKTINILEGVVISDEILWHSMKISGWIRHLGITSKPLEAKLVEHSEQTLKLWKTEYAGLKKNLYLKTPF